MDTKIQNTNEDQQLQYPLMYYSNANNTSTYEVAFFSGVDGDNRDDSIVNHDVGYGNKGSSSSSSTKHQLAYQGNIYVREQHLALFTSFLSSY